MHYVAGYEDGTIRIWQSGTGQLVREIAAHSNIVTDISWSPDGTRIASSSYDGTAAIWDFTTGQLMHRIQLDDIIYDLAWKPDSSRILTMTELSPNNLKIWDSVTGNLVSETETPVGTANYSPDGARVLVTHGGFIEVYDTENFSLLNTIFSDFQDNWGGIWHPTQNLAATLSTSSQVLVWDIWSESTVLSLQANDSSRATYISQSVISISFRHSNSLLTAVSYDGTLRSWDTQTWGLVQDTSIGSTVFRAEFSPDGSKLLYADDMGNPPQVIDVPDPSAQAQATDSFSVRHACSRSR